MVNLLKLITVTATPAGYEVSPFVLAREFSETNPPSKFVNWKAVPFWLQYSPGNPTVESRPSSAQQTLADYKSLPRLKLADGVYTFDVVCEPSSDDMIRVSATIQEIVLSIKPYATNIIDGCLWTMIPKMADDGKPE